MSNRTHTPECARTATLDAIDNGERDTRSLRDEECTCNAIYQPDPLTKAYGRGVGDALSGDTWDELARLRDEVERLRLLISESAPICGVRCPLIAIRRDAITREGGEA